MRNEDSPSTAVAAARHDQPIRSRRGESPASRPTPRRATDRDRHPEHWRLLVETGVRRDLPVGGSLHLNDEGSCSLVLVTRGAVKLVGIADSGATRTLAVRRCGSVVVEYGLVAHARRSIQVVALVPATVATVSAYRLAAIVRSHPDVAPTLLQITAARTAESDHRIIEHTSWDAPARIRRTLFELSNIFENDTEPTVVPLTQQDLAGLAGVSREATAKVLRRLRDVDAVRTARSRLVIVRPDLIAKDN